MQSSSKVCEQKLGFTSCKQPVIQHFVAWFRMHAHLTTFVLQPILQRGGNWVVIVIKKKLIEFQVPSSY